MDLYQEIVLGLGTVILVHGIYLHWRIARWSGWLEPFRLYMVIFAIIEIGRLVSQCAKYDLVDDAVSRQINTAIFLAVAILAVRAARIFRKKIKVIFDELLSEGEGRVALARDVHGLAGLKDYVDGQLLLIRSRLHNLEGSVIPREREVLELLDKLQQKLDVK